MPDQTSPPIIRLLVAALAAAPLLAVPAAVAGTREDVDNAYALGKGAVDSGVATGFDYRPETLNVHIGSMRPGDARAVAEALCTIGRTHMAFEVPLTVRVFLVVGERPAAVCTTKREGRRRG